MRGRKIILLLSVMLCMFLISVLCGSVAAEQSYIEMEGEPTYYCYHYDTSPSIYYYFINVTFYNSGDESSEEIDFKIFEDEKQSIAPEKCQNVVFTADESKSFTFNWSTAFAVKTIEIKWMPSSLNDEHTIYNNGSYSLTVTHDSAKDTNDTPGFEIPIVVLALCILFCIRRFELKKSR